MREDAPRAVGTSDTPHCHTIGVVAQRKLARAGGAGGLRLLDAQQVIHHITLHYITSHHITLHYTASHHITSQHST